MKMSVLIEATKGILTEESGLFRRVDSYSDIADRLRQAGYRLLRRHHHVRIWIKSRKVIVVYMRHDQALRDWISFCKSSTNRHAPRVSKGPVEVSEQFSMVGFNDMGDLSDSRWKKIKELEDYSDKNNDPDDFEQVRKDYPALWRLMLDLQRRSFFRRFDYDLGKSSWLESRTIPILFMPFWTTRAGQFRE